MSTTDFIAQQQGNLFEGVSNVSEAVYAMTKGNIGRAVGATAAQIEQELTSPQLAATREEIRSEPDEAAQKALKEQHKFDIPGLCPHFSGFRDDHRAAADALPECCTCDTCCDVDEREYGQQAVDAALRLNSEPGMFHDKLLYVEHSLRGGLDANGKATKVHIWWRQPIGMTAIETQQAFSQAAGVPVDPAMQQKQAFVYMTGDTIYRGPLWLVPVTPEQRDAYQTAFRLRGLSIDGWDKLPATDEQRKPFSATDEHGVTRNGNVATDEHGQVSEADIAEPTPRTDYIFDRHYRMTGLPLEHITTDGKLHNTLKSLLSTGICALLTKEEMQGQLRKRTPDYWQCKDCQQLVSDFYAKYNDPARALTREQRQILAAAERIGEKGIALNPDVQDTEEQPYCEELTLSEIYASPVPPRLNPKMMPRVIKAVTSRTPDIYVECVAQAIFPALEAHPVGLSALHEDKRYRELRACCLVIAPTGSGKACISLPIKHAMADIVAKDAPERKKERQYNEAYNTRNANQDKPCRPPVRVRCLMPNVTQAALARRTDESGGAPLFVMMNEIEQFDKIEGVSGAKNSFTNMKINDDEGNDFGQERAGTQSVQAASSLFMNWVGSTTPSQAIRYFRHVLVDGPISRLTVATITDPGLGAPMPVFGDYNESYDALIKPFIDNLNAATGKIVCRQAIKLVKELKEECDRFAVESGDRVWDNLTHRALVHIFRKCICIFCANGMKWENSTVMKNFMRWALHYDLYIKMATWGDAIRKAEEDTPTSKHGPRNMLELLPEEFTATDLSNVRFAQGKDREGTRNQIAQWLHRKLVLRMTDDRFKKA